MSVARTAAPRHAEGEQALPPPALSLQPLEIWHGTPPATYPGATQVTVAALSTAAAGPALLSAAPSGAQKVGQHSQHEVRSNQGELQVGGWQFGRWYAAVLQLWPYQTAMVHISKHRTHRQVSYADVLSGDDGQPQVCVSRAVWEAAHSAALMAPRCRSLSTSTS